MKVDRVFRVMYHVLGGLAALRMLWPALQSIAIVSIPWLAALVFSVGVAVVWVFFRWPKLLGMSKGIVASMLVIRGERVLLVHDDDLQKWVLPNDHVRLREDVDKTALRAVKTLELKYAAHSTPGSPLDVEFDNRWHSKEENVVTDRKGWIVRKHPEPFYVQSERQERKEGHSIHYNLVYVGCLKNDLHANSMCKGTKRNKTDTQWVTPGEIDSMFVEEKVYKDTAIVARLAIRGPLEPATK